MLPTTLFTLTAFLFSGSFGPVAAQGALSVRHSSEYVINSDPLSQPQPDSSHQVRPTQGLSNNLLWPEPPPSQAALNTISIDSHGVTHAIAPTSAVNTAASSEVISHETSSSQQRSEGHDSQHPPTAGPNTKPKTTTRAKLPAKSEPGSLTRGLSYFKLKDNKSTVASSMAVAKSGTISRSHCLSGDFLGSLGRTTLGSSTLLPILTSSEQRLDVPGDTKTGSYGVPPTSTSGNEDVPGSLLEGSDDNRAPPTALSQDKSFLGGHLRGSDNSNTGSNTALPISASSITQRLLGGFLGGSDGSNTGGNRASPSLISGNDDFSGSLTRSFDNSDTIIPSTASPLSASLIEGLRNSVAAGDSNALPASFLEEHDFGNIHSIGSSSTSAAANHALLSPISTDEPYGPPNMATDQPPGTSILSTQSLSPAEKTNTLNVDRVLSGIMSGLGPSSTLPWSSAISSSSSSDLPDDLSTDHFLSLPTTLATLTSSTNRPQGLTVVTLSVPSELTRITAGLSVTETRSIAPAGTVLDSENLISVTPSLSATIGAGNLLLANSQLTTQASSNAIPAGQPNTIMKTEKLNLIGTTPRATPSESNTWLPLNFLSESPSTTTDPINSGTLARASGLAPQLPEAIFPHGGSQGVPEHKTLIQLGFNEKLPYRFVATTPSASSQIFLYVPEGLEYALQDANNEVSMLAIRPFDNAKYTGYVATVALAYIPVDQNKILQTMIHDTHSKLYEQPNKAVRALMSMIDPSIPLDVDGGGVSSTGFEPSGSSERGNSKNNGTESNGSADGGASSSSQPRTSSVGIGLGTVAGAIAYGAGVFWIVRSYRRRLQSHQRLGSDIDISAPVMTQNSLGWS